MCETAAKNFTFAFRREKSVWGGGCRRGKFYVSGDLRDRMHRTRLLHQLPRFGVRCYVNDRLKVVRFQPETRRVSTPAMETPREDFGLYLRN